MKKIVLTQEETDHLNKFGVVEITRYGFDIVVEKFDEMESGYMITIVNPFEKVVLK